MGLADWRARLVALVAVLVASATLAGGTWAGLSAQSASQDSSFQAPEGSAPQNTAPPQVRDDQQAEISGSPYVGDTLTAATGTWTGSPTFAYRWQRCSLLGDACQDIAGATGATYVLAAADFDHRIRVTVAATNQAGSTEEVSAPTGRVAVREPLNIAAPQLTGTARAGQTLTATTGTWLGDNLTFETQWLRCDTAGENCVTISGATGDTRVLTAADVGGRIRARVIATQGVDSNQATSSPSAVVQDDVPVNTGAPSITGTPAVGQTLTANPGQLEAATSFSYQWQRCDPAGENCADLSGHTGETYEPAWVDIGATLRVRVTAHGANGSASAPSAAVGPVTGPPQNTSPPSIGGTATVGQTLTGTDGTWSSDAPVTFTRQWERCDASQTTCQSVAGATSTTYTVTAADRGSRLRVRVTATNAAGSAQAVSAATAVVPVEAAATTATRVYGQLGSFTTNTANNGGITANASSLPQGIAVDSSGGVYIADTNNHRVLYYPAGQTTATRVYGQAGSFATGTANKNGISANSLNAPQAVALGNDGVYICDTANNRILWYAGDSTTASIVYGQGGSFATNTQNKGGVSASALRSPTGIAVSPGGESLYVADNGNSRVLRYAWGSATATAVYGQGGSFTTLTYTSASTPSAVNLPTVQGVAVDGSGGVYASDTNNHRVLYYPAGQATATRVYGQASFTTRVTGVSATNLNTPRHVVLDAAGGLYVADSVNHRVVYFPAGQTTATRVYGQGGVFTTNTVNKGGISANSLNTPRGFGVDAAGGLYVGDSGNNRSLYYPPGP